MTAHKSDRAGEERTSEDTMRTPGDVKADVDRALRGLDDVPLADLRHLVERIHLLAAGHHDILDEALERVRRHVPSSIIPLVRLSREFMPHREMDPSCRPATLFAPRPLRGVFAHDLAFDMVIPAGKSRIIATPQFAAFRGEMLIIPKEECTAGDLLEISVANRVQTQANPMLPRPLALYCPARWSKPKLMELAKLHFDTATVGMPVSLTVVVEKPMRFQAVLRGVSAA